jgi:hypothetical protein
MGDPVECDRQDDPIVSPASQGASTADGPKQGLILAASIWDLVNDI